VQAELLQRISDLEADNQRLHAENMRLRARLDLINAGTLVPLDD
jgi:cell division protein FtsB